MSVWYILNKIHSFTLVQRCPPCTWRMTTNHRPYFFKYKINSAIDIYITVHVKTNRFEQSRLPYSTYYEYMMTTRRPMRTLIFIITTYHRSPITKTNWY